MKKRKKIKAISLAVLMLSCLLSACRFAPMVTTTNDVPQTAVYRVKVLGVDGEPATEGVIVRFLKDGQEQLQKTDAAGVAMREMPKGDYTVEIMFLDPHDAYYYETADMTLTAIKTELTVELAYMADEPTKLHYGSDANRFYEVYHVGVGRTYVPLGAECRSYFLFTPEEAGVYRLSVVGDIYAVGCYGTPFFIQQSNTGVADGNMTLITVSPDMIGANPSGTAVFVIGVDNPEKALVNALLQIERVSAYVDTSVPTQIYETTGSLTAWTLPEDAILHSFDLTAPTGAYTLVLDEETGFYHLASVEGPLVLVCLGEASNHRLQYAASYDTVLQTVRVNKYFTDHNGNYTYKEDYSPCLQNYIGNRDLFTGQYVGGCVDRETGLYPLTADLMYIIQQSGDYAGWWDILHNGYLFKDVHGENDPAVNPEIAWLFMCVYMQVKT